jgi:hypothetical protein
VHLFQAQTLHVHLFQTRCTLQLVHLDLSNNNLDSFLKNIGGPEKGRFTLLGHPSKDKVFFMTHYGEHFGLFLRENPLVIVQINQ